MATSGKEFALLGAVHVVRDAKRPIVDVDHVERVLCALSRTPAARCSRAALRDNDPLILVSARLHIQRIADIRPMKVPAQYQLDAEIHKAIERPFRFGHRLIAFVVGRGREMMVSNNDSSRVGGRVVKSMSTEIKLMLLNSAV